MRDQATLPWFARLNASLNDTLDDAAFLERLRQSTRMLRALAAEMLERSGRACDGLEEAGAPLRALLADTGVVAAGPAGESFDGLLEGVHAA